MSGTGDSSSSTSAAGAPTVTVVGDNGKVDLSKCTVKRNGRSIVWKKKLFMLDAKQRGVCTVCREVVNAPMGNTGRLPSRMPTGTS